MVPFSAFATTHWAMGPTTVSRYNSQSAYEIQGQAAPGSSSGDAMDDMVRLQKQLPPGTGYSLSGLSYQEQLSGGQAPLLYGLSVLVVFLCLAALYESWSIPLAVLLVIPLGLIGAVLAVTLRSEEHTSELQSLMRISYAVFCLKKKTSDNNIHIRPFKTKHDYKYNQLN